jgi:hypothetical protein
MYKIRLSIAIFTILGSLLSGCTTPSGMKWPNDAKISPSSAVKPATVKKDEGLRLSIETEKQNYHIGEPIYVIVRLTNTYGKPRTVMTELRPGEGAITVYISSAEEKSVPYEPLVNVDYDASVIKTLQPQETIGDVFPVFFGGRGWTFVQEGDYQLVAVYHTQMQDGVMSETKSSPISINIEKTPDGSGQFLLDQQDEEAYEAGKFLMWQAGDHLELGIERLAQLTRRWPESVLSSYAAFAIGKSLGQPFMDYRKQSVRSANCVSSLEYLSRVKQEQLSRNTRVQYQLAKFRCHAMRGDRKAASVALTEARALMEKRPEYKALNIRVDDYEKYLK